ncbi:hypothetical protein Dda_2451 [Drechslerella dactyloides]|uniref:NAD(P)-binding protein n=1 Tax=Drechslerella dactyloides TaxID=74499 RepID=A0AAD6NLY3_DREDA|nr:hypothetical protein Dda_2451 [Drechslerella dactyloides]
MPSYAITGASRGIGLGFIQVLSRDPSNTVFALVRNPTSSPALTELARSNKNIHIVQADVTSPTQMAEAAAQVSKVTGGKLDVLVENAATLFTDATALTPLDLTSDAEKLQQFQKSFEVSLTDNVMSIVYTTAPFLDLVRNSDQKKILVLSTGIADVDAILMWDMATNIPYAASKAAMNVLVAKYAVQLKADGVTIVSISPGLVQTSHEESMVKMYEAITAIFRRTHPDFPGPLTPEQSVNHMLETLKKLTVKDTGRFMSHYGNREWL